jgi:hypothetical protein
VWLGIYVQLVDGKDPALSTSSSSTSSAAKHGHSDVDAEHEQRFDE